MTPTTSGRKVSVLESIGAHLLLTLAVCFALYPVLWVVSLAFSGVTDLEPESCPSRSSRPSSTCAASSAAH
jgi:ABC-type maltose transport system permease subunit